MSKIYCSIGNIPKGSKLGTMKQCAEMNQVRYYGIKKIDSKLLEAIKKGSKEKESKTKLLISIAGLRGKVKNLKGKIEAAKTKEAKEKHNKELKAVQDELQKSLAKFKKMNSQSGGSRKGSKKIDC